ncbi:MAG: hypothetical protein AUJ34_03115 [Parcubacteria group bacterium CG1_02_41_12]|nr:MAG: hypothetical protein AUJ34_03115 [Parcubacteria group bacterium CG1_02_41_12]
MENSNTPESRDDKENHHESSSHDLEPRFLLQLCMKAFNRAKLALNKYQARTYLKTIIIVVVLIGATFGAKIGYDYITKGELRLPFINSPKYTQAYSLVADAISQSADIIINLPIGVDAAQAKEFITFTPAVAGVWVESDQEEKLVFRPSEPLRLNRYYTITLQTPEGVIGKDFLSTENPSVVSILPNNEAEANENSEITIVFNRPMVPLTTLDELEAGDIPVEITPQTEGRFKWAGTRTLQFIPKDTLIASANYTAKVKEGFISMDNLPLEPFEYSFTTRHLRLEYVQDKSLVYSQPMVVKYNQPVDLDRMKAGITVEDIEAKHNVDFIAEYGTKDAYNSDTKKQEKITDESIIFIYNARDAHGRARLWDFEKGYYLNIQNAYPKHGDINIEDDHGAYRKVTGVIRDVSAVSERSSQVREDFFDPQGQLSVSFYEDIDLRGSSISADYLKGIVYAQKCVEEEQYSDNCAKEDDKSRILMSFDADKLVNSQTITVRFRSIKNTEGLKINPSEMTRTITIIPDFKIYRTVPGNGSQNTELTELTLCANAPLRAPTKEEVEEYVQVNDTYEYKRFGYSHLVRPDETQWYDCNAGEFETSIYYGLMPEHDYTVSVNAWDEFGRNQSIASSFKTGTMPSQELNFYHFQDDYSVTQPNKTTFTYAGVNMEYVNMHICQLSAENMVRTLENKPNYTSGPEALSNCDRIIEKKIELLSRFWVKNYFQVKLSDYVGTDFGHYVITFWHPDYRQQWGEYKTIYERSYVSITNLSVVEKKVNIQQNKENEFSLDENQRNSLQNLYWVANVDTLAPISGARVELFGRVDGYTSPLEKVATAFTNADGIARTIPQNYLEGVVVSSGVDSAIVSNDESGVNNSATAFEASKLYLYTDRPIYRPGNEVHVKGLYRVGYDGDYEILAGKKVPVKIYNAQNQEIFNQELEVNNFGTINTTITLDTKASLGSYRIQTPNNSAFFDVEEYVPAAFKVEAITDKEEYISGDDMKLDIDADYYFGVPLEGGEVEYGISSQDYHFDKYADENFSFGSGWYYCYGCSYGDKFVLRKSQPLAAGGTARIIQNLDLDALFEGDDDIQSKILTLYITVTNINGEAVSTQKSFVVHRGEFYLGVKASQYFAAKNQALQARVKSVDTEGAPTQVRNIAVAVNKVDWVHYKRQEVDGGYYYGWEKELTPVKKWTTSTDGSGDWSSDFSVAEAGQYELSVRAKDARDNPVSDTSYLYIYGEEQVSVRPTNDNSLEVVTDNPSVSDSGQASIIITSPYESAKALITLERGKIFEYQVVDINQSIYQYAFSMKKEYIPNVVATVTLLSTEPSVKYGQVAFSVNTDERELSISVEPNKEEYLPGEDVSLGFVVTDRDGIGVSTELSVAVADLSVLALKGNPKKNPLPFFYAGFPQTITTTSNIKNILHEVDVPTGTKGGGGLNPDDLATKKRGIFKDTAFWQAVLVTDANGRAQVRFTLPDNLTTWQIESIGITQDTKVGVAYQEFTARKQLMVTPLKPRFIVPGDTFLLGAKVFNQTGSRQKLDVSLQSDTLALNKDDAQKSVTLGAGETKIVYFNMSAPNDQWYGQHTFVMAAENNDFKDEVEQQLKIRRNDTYETVATAGASNTSPITEYVFAPGSVIPDKGGLTIQHSATLAVFLSDALNSLLSFPYGCSEQIASKLDALAAVKSGLNIQNIGDTFALREVEFEGVPYSLDQLVDIGLTRLYETQKQDGSFSYYPNTSSSKYLTLHVANTLKDLSDAGYQVNQDSLKRASNYINNMVNDREYRDSNDFAILSAYTAYRLRDKKQVHDYFETRIKQILKDEALLHEKLGNESLVYLALLLSEREGVFGSKSKDMLFATLSNKVDVDARGAFLPVNSSRIIWQYHETPIKDTALLLKAFVADERDDPMLDRVMRWLLASRSKDGAWGSTNATISVIDSFTDYLQWKHENESQYTITVSLGKNEKDSFTYGPDNIFAQNSMSVPMWDIALDELSAIQFVKSNENEQQNNVYYDVSLKYFLPVDEIAPRDEGFTIERALYALDDKDGEHPLNEVTAGDVLRGELKIIVPNNRNFVAIEDFIPAGVELVNFNLATTDKSLKDEYTDTSSYGWYYSPGTKNRTLRPDVEELRDDRLYLFSERLSPGQYTYTYFVRALVPGTFHHLPAVVSEMYFPENFARTRGEWFEVME